jgi:uncharacterized protein
VLVFISYHTPDRKSAQAIEAALALRRPGIQLLLAPRNVSGGAWWVRDIAETIGRADAVLFLAGKRIGPWQELEYYEALRLSRERSGRPRVIPVVTVEQAPGLPFFSQLHQIFAADPVTQNSLDAIERALDDTQPPDMAPPWQRFQPYKGLPALEEADAAFFFGRDKETAAILDLMVQHPNRIIALIGQSGVGKSSLARAGVLARLKSQLWPLPTGEWPAGLNDSRAWLPLVIRPGEQPLKELALAFAQLYCERSFELDEEAEGWSRRFAAGARLKDMLRATRDRLATALGAEAPKRFVVYIDQGEELYTRADPGEALQFSALVAEAPAHEAFSVLLSLRSDYYAAYQNDRAMFDASANFDLLPLTRDVLGEIVRRPAASLGARFESEDMADRVADATNREPGALPLLSDLLHEMWLHMQARGDGVLRWSDNPEIVDVAAPLRRRADAFLADPANNEGVVRRLFTLRLAHVPEIGEPVRRRAHRAECGAEEWVAAEKLAGQDWRLLTLAGAADGESVVEVAHEQLLRRWPRLKSWLEEEREFLVWKGQVEHTAASHAALPGAEQDGALLMGRPLAIARGWFERRAADLAPQTRAFVGASLAAESARRGAEQRRNRRVLIGTAAGLAIALVLAGFAGWQWRVARSEKVVAEHNLQLATQTANGLVSDLAVKFQNFGLPATTVQNILGSALHLLDQLAAGGESMPALRRSQGKALIDASISFRTVGDSSRALSEASEARDIFEALLATNPSDSDAKRELATSIRNMGDALEDQGDYQDALSRYRDSLALYKALTDGDASNADWQRGVEGDDEMIGEILRRQGDLSGALNALDEDLSIAKMLVAKYPANLDFQFDLSESDNKVGDVLLDQGNFGGATAVYRDGLTIRETLVKGDRSDLYWQRGLAQSKLRLGDARKAQNDLAGALGAYRDALETINVLAMKDPGNSALQQDLADANVSVGNVLGAQGDHAGALAAYRESLAIVRALSQKDPVNGDWQRRLANTSENIGEVLQADGDRAGAASAYRESLATLRPLMNRAPSNQQWQDDVAYTDERLGYVLWAAGNHTDAVAAYRENLVIRRTLAQTDPSNVDWQTKLVLSLLRMADASEAPAADLGEALAILKRLDAAGKLPPDKKDWVNQIAAKQANAPEATTGGNSASKAFDEEALRKGDDAYGRKEYTEAMRWYQSAADHGNPQAQGNISRLYLFGLGVPVNYAEAIQWAQKAADQGNPRGQTVLGLAYAQNPGAAQDFTEAMRWYRKAADQGYAAAEANIGLLFANGNGVKQDYAEAMRWYRKAADQGMPEAQNAVGALYHSGWGTGPDYAEAMHWYRKAADQGFSTAQYNIGQLYLNGLGVKQDNAEAMSWYRKAAEQGDSDAQNSVGMLYEDGQRGVKQDYTEAMSWYRKAADQGNAAAQNNVGTLYYNGSGITQDYAEAAHWFRKAADQGQADAQSNLGVLYENGYGVVQDYAIAMRWYSKAADQGNANAQRNIGNLYATGKGVARDDEQARTWMQKAAAGGNDDARKWLAAH